MKPRFGSDSIGLKLVRRGAVSALLGVDWAARIDLIHEPSSGRLVFLECDAAPLIAAGSALATSFVGAGLDRARQLRLLLNEDR